VKNTMQETSLTSPFYSRAYGGYTQAQMDFARRAIGPLSGVTVLDPMGGQAHALGQWASCGASVTIEDVNPGCLALATLRDPRVIRRSDSLAARLRILLRKSRCLQDLPTEHSTESWLSASTQLRLVRWGEEIGAASPAALRTALEGRSLFRRFAVAITVLAARRLASFRRTDNLTWLKPGGLVKSLSIADTIDAELTRWCDWAGEFHEGRKSAGHVAVVWRESAPSSSVHDFVVTSPPYANRLDYTRLWAPELAILAALSGIDVQRIKIGQIGSNLVRGSRANVNLPGSIELVLRQIRRDPTPFSDTYYYEFFKHYAEELVTACDGMAARVKQGGVVVVFVRDTVRKDVLFPTGKLVDWALCRQQHGLKKSIRKSLIVRSHVGYRRKNQVSGLFGLAQREHWLTYRKNLR
jgi:hypothetical protein